MRFKVTFSLKYATKNRLLPLNYQYEIASWIYSLLAESDAEYTKRLHNEGYGSSHKQFRLFTFSNLQLPFYRICDRALYLESGDVVLYVSFLMEEGQMNFLQGLFMNREMTIAGGAGTCSFVVSKMELLPETAYRIQMHYRTSSPVCITRQREDGGVDYLSPTDETAEQILGHNLWSKYRAMCSDNVVDKEEAIYLSILGKPKRKLITIKEGTPQASQIVGYLFDFVMTAPLAYQRIAHEAGLGMKNAMGFGALEEIS